MATYFSFLHLYTSWLLILSVFSIPTAVIQYIETDSMAVVSYSVLVSVWAVVMLEYWVRKNNVMAWRWNMTSYETVERDLHEYQEGKQPAIHRAHAFVPYRPAVTVELGVDWVGRVPRGRGQEGGT